MKSTVRTYNNVSSPLWFSDDALVFTVATAVTDGFQRYMFSAREYRIKPIVLGMGEQWKGGEDIKRKPGGGWKINLLKEALEPYKDDKDRPVLFTDAYDVIFVSDLREILEKFSDSGARVLFGAEGYCWPRTELAPEYPEVARGKKYLNSGLFIGYAKELYQLLNYKPIKDTDDDQLFFTEAYLNKTFREALKFKLDHTSELFQNLNGAASEVELVDEDSKDSSYKILKNVVMHTRPLIIHGNGPSKIYLNNFANYLAKAYHPVEGCRHCKLGELNLQSLKELPVVMIAIFVEDPTPFLEEQLRKVHKIDYPKNRIHLFIHNTVSGTRLGFLKLLMCLQVKFHSDHISEFVKECGSEYLSLKQIKPDDETTEWTARDLSL